MNSVEEAMVTVLKQSEYFSLQLDESTDVPAKEQTYYLLFVLFLMSQWKKRCFANLSPNRPSK